MTERENVIEHLKEIAEYFRGCRSNASFASKAENHFWELQNAANEVAELLKEQEPVEPIEIGDKARCVDEPDRTIGWKVETADGGLAARIITAQIAERR